MLPPYAVRVDNRPVCGCRHTSLCDIRHGWSLPAVAMASTSGRHRLLGSGKLPRTNCVAWIFAQAARAAPKATRSAAGRKASSSPRSVCLTTSSFTLLGVWIFKQKASTGRNARKHEHLSSQGAKKGKAQLPSEKSHGGDDCTHGRAITLFLVRTHEQHQHGTT